MTTKAAPAKSVQPATGSVAGQLIPKHVAIIMDGNGRWAGERGLPRTEGHKAGTENIRRILRRFADHGVAYLTLFTFSTENWGRPDEEVGALMELLRESIANETQRLHADGVRINHIGRLDRLSPELREGILESMEFTKDNQRITLSVAFDYGGRAEIVDAVRAIVAEALEPDEITEDVVERHLHTQGLPDPDLVIRTAGEMRISNFLLWQTAYAEYYSTPALWPDFDEAEVDAAVVAYGSRQRRYGKVTTLDSE